MALQIKHDDSGDEPAKGYYGSSWTESTTAREPKEGGNGEPEFNPELEFDVVNSQGSSIRPPASPPIIPDRRYATVPKDSGPKVLFDVKLIKIIIAVIIILVLPVILYKKVIHPKPKDLTPLMHSSYDELDAQIDGEFTRDTKMDKYIPKLADNITIEAYSGGDIYPFMVDGEFGGIHLAERKWEMYGVSVGMAEAEAVKKTTYVYEKSMVTILDLAGGQSNAYYYYNKKNNDCLVMTVNGTSNKVVAVTYYRDYNKLTQNLIGIDDD